LREGRLAETRWAGEQHVVQRLAAGFGSLDENHQVFTRLFLPDKFGEAPRAKTRFQRVLFPSLSGYNAAWFF
jgi:hypothetical protein